MSSYSTLMAHVGRIVALEEKGYAVFCEVVDARMSYGDLQYRLTPRSGIGIFWVSASRCVTVDE